jgi:uncharacterized protein
LPDLNTSSRPANIPDSVDAEVGMTISKELLEILACPACKEAGHLTADGTGLKCEKCHRIYPIHDDIPVMLIDEAKIEQG